ncbi:hypothetical protein GLA29479_4344 [Lysobacter antibioticus]|nr:hypothetical protein GLA29479_4344 [Lysobacter antibioticus]
MPPRRDSRPAGSARTAATTIHSQETRARWDDVRSASFP